jgi:hypothetical protein
MKLKLVRCMYADDNSTYIGLAAPCIICKHFKFSTSYVPMCIRENREINLSTLENELIYKYTEDTRCGCRSMIYMRGKRIKLL